MPFKNLNYKNLINQFLETNYPRDRAIGVFRSFHFDLKVQNPKFVYYTSPKTVQNSFDLSSRRGIIGNPEAKPRGILLIKPVKNKFYGKEDKKQTRLVDKIKNCRSQYLNIT